MCLCSVARKAEGWLVWYGLRSEGLSLFHMVSCPSAGWPGLTHMGAEQSSKTVRRNVTGFLRLRTRNDIESLLQHFVGQSMLAVRSSYIQGEAKQSTFLNGENCRVTLPRGRIQRMGMIIVIAVGEISITLRFVQYWCRCCTSKVLYKCYFIQLNKNPMR